MPSTPPARFRKPAPAFLGGPGPQAPAPPRADVSTRKVRPDRDYVAGGDRWGAFGGYLKSLPAYIDDLTYEFGPDLYDRMQLDDQVSSSLRALVHSVLSDDMVLRPAVDDRDDSGYGRAKEYLAFCERSTWGQTGSLDQWLKLMCQGALGGGNRVSEWVLRPEESGKDAGRLVLDHITVKPRRSVAFVVDCFNSLVGIAGQAATTAVAWGTAFSTDGKDGPPILPREKFCVLSWDPHDGDPRGSALIRCVYKVWYEKLEAARDWMAHLAQFGSPSLVGTTAPGADSSAATDTFGNPTGGDVLTPEQDFLNQILAFRNGTAIVIPNGASLLALQVASAGDAFIKKVDACDRAIARGILLAMRATMESEHGSKADSETAQDVSGLQARFVKRWLARMVTEDLLRNLVRVNYGPEAARHLCPYASLSPVEHQDLGPSLTAVAGAWANQLIKPSQLPWVYEQFGMPPAKPEELNPPPQPQDAGGQSPANAPGATVPGDAAGRVSTTTSAGTSTSGKPGRDANGWVSINGADAPFGLWQESLHRRGQPENRGEFGPGGGGPRPPAVAAPQASAAVAQPAAQAPPPPVAAPPWPPAGPRDTSKAAAELREAVRSRMTGALGKTRGISRDKRAAFAQALKGITDMMPAEALRRVNDHGKSHHFYEDPESLAVGGAGHFPEKFRKDLEEALDDGYLVNGAYVPGNGSLHYDGADTTGIMAHEMTHALDPRDVVSDSPAWKEAFGAELADSQLCAYAATCPSEGLAELGRVLYGGQVDPAVLEEKFPLSMKALKDAKLW